MTAALIAALATAAVFAGIIAWLDARLHTEKRARLAAEVEAGDAVAELVQWRSIFAGVAQDLMADAEAAVERAEWLR